jgi:hypothetical protein
MCRSVDQHKRFYERRRVQAPGWSIRLHPDRSVVSYWQDIESILDWRAQVEHRVAQRNGKAIWYEHFEVRIAKVERAYAKRVEASLPGPMNQG